MATLGVKGIKVKFMHAGVLWQVPAGQRINVTLYEFGATAQRSTHMAGVPGKSVTSIVSHLAAPAAETYGQLREHNSRRRPIEIIGRDIASNRPSGDPQRLSHVLTTDTSAVEVFMYDVPGHNDFLLTLTGNVTVQSSVR